MSTWGDGAGVVEFPDGRRVRGRGLRRPLPDSPTPIYGVYLVGRDPGGLEWPYDWVRCRDFAAPSDPARAIEVLRAAFERAERERVEVGCGGGVGRTGLALAVMATFAGVPVGDAVTWVRANYHRRAVETPWQRRWVISHAPR